MKKTQAQRKPASRGTTAKAKKPAAAPRKTAKPSRPVAAAKKPAPKAAPTKAAPPKAAPRVAAPPPAAPKRPPAQEVTTPGRKRPAPAAAVVAAPAIKKPVVLRDYDKEHVERAAKAILKALRPLVSDDDEGDAEAQRNRLTLEAAHPRRRPDGNYEVFLRYNAGSALQDPESEAEGHARAWFERAGEYPGIPLAVDVNVLEERDA